MFMNQTAAIYARVSSDKQKEQNTIASQTQALQEYAQAHQYTVPPEWIFEDEGYSGSNLVRPALERLRDLVAEGAIESILVYAPDRLSRNYAYQVLLLEEFARHGANTLFVKAPSVQTPEERLLVQFQGMIAEYERAQMTERCRRGKRYRAKAGDVGVLSAAPYGYRYVKKSLDSQAYYEILEREADVVRQVFHLYTVEGCSARAIAQRLNAEKIPTRSQKARWNATTLWTMLRNPAYQGLAAYGKTEHGPPQRITRISRQQGITTPRWPSKRARPSEEWIRIPVPPLVSPETFELAQERLKVNQALSARRTKIPSLLQSLLVCGQCGYAFYRSRTRPRQSKHGTLYPYYRCWGNDRHRPNGRVCNARPIRVDVLDQVVWEQVWHLLNHPDLIRGEIERRLQEHQQSDPVQQRQEKVAKELVRLDQQIDKLIDAYQEGLMDLVELRTRIPELKRRQLALKKELESLSLQALEQNRLLAMNESMERFVAELNNSAQKLDIKQKQQIVRLLVRQVVIGPQSVTIHHSIPIYKDQSRQKVPIYLLRPTRQDGSFTP